MKKLFTTILLVLVSISFSAHSIVTEECNYIRMGSRIKCRLSYEDNKCFIHIGLFSKKQPSTMLNDVFIIETMKGDIPLMISNTTSKSNITDGLYSIPIDIADVEKIKKGVDCIKFKRNDEEKIYRNYAYMEGLEYEAFKISSRQKKDFDGENNKYDKIYTDDDVIIKANKYITSSNVKLNEMKPFFNVSNATDKELIGCPVICKIVQVRKSNLSGSEGRVVIRPLYIDKHGEKIKAYGDIYVRGKNRSNVKYWLLGVLPIAGSGAKIPTTDSFTIYLK